MEGREAVAVKRLILTAILAAGCGGEDGSNGPWQFNVDTITSDGPARQTSWLRSVGKEGPEGEPRTEAAILSFDCFRGNTSTTIMTDQALRQGSVDVRMTVDSAQPGTVPGFAGTTPTGGMVVLTITQDSMLGILSGRQRVLFEYADGAGSYRTTAEFPVTGVEKHRGPFLAACAKRGG
jgi:hypothetical protein